MDAQSANSGSLSHEEPLPRVSTDMECVCGHTDICHFSSFQVQKEGCAIRGCTCPRFRKATTQKEVVRLEAVRHHVRHIEALHGDGSDWQKGYSEAIAHIKRCLDIGQRPLCEWTEGVETPYRETNRETVTNSVGYYKKEPTPICNEGRTDSDSREANQ